MALSVFAFAGCDGNRMPDGVYELDRLYINGQQVGEDNPFFIGFAAMPFEVKNNGTEMTIIVLGVPMTAEIRIRNGYIEQRHPELTNGRWGREDGSAAADFVSSRFEDGEIVLRVGAASPMTLGAGSLKIVFAIPQAEARPPSDNNNQNNQTIDIEQLFGRWNLTQITHNPGNVTQTPQSLDWIFDYHITLNDDNTFSEINFWNWNVHTGTWALNGNTLTLTRQTGTTPLGGYAFVSIRNISLSSDTNTMTMTYTRFIYGMTFSYSSILIRA